MYRSANPPQHATAKTQQLRVTLSSERVVCPGVCHTPVIVGISTIGDRRVDYAPIGERGEGRGTTIHFVAVGGGVEPSEV